MLNKPDQKRTDGNFDMVRHVDCGLSSMRGLQVESDA